jgi:membrane-associated phospholipid phosphatase
VETLSCCSTGGRPGSPAPVRLNTLVRPSPVIAAERRAGLCSSTREKGEWRVPLLESREQVLLRAVLLSATMFLVSGVVRALRMRETETNVAADFRQRVRLAFVSSNRTDCLYLFTFSLVSLGLMLRPERVPHWISWLVVNFLCFVAITLLIRKRRYSPVCEFLHDWYPVSMFIVCFEEVSRLSFLLRNEWQDHYLLRFETSLFPIPPTVWLGHLGAPWVTELMELGYFSYFVLFIIVGAALYRPGRKHAFRQMTDATVLAYLLCYTIFVLFPTQGPAYTLAARHNFPLPGAGPFHWAVMFIQANAGVHGNAFPSAHVAGGVVALLFAWRYAPRVGFCLTPLVVLLCLGAVYDRYHYASDVVAGAIIGAIPAVSIMRMERVRS